MTMEIDRLVCLLKNEILALHINRKKTSKNYFYCVSHYEIFGLKLIPDA